MQLRCGGVGTVQKLNTIKLDYIMKIESQVCTLEQAMMLKKLGVNEPSVFYWAVKNTPHIRAKVEDYGHPQGSTPHAAIRISEEKICNPNCFNAYTVGELGAMLPMPQEIKIDADHIMTWKPGGIARENDKWLVEYGNDVESSLHRAHGMTEAECRAALLILLLESKIISLQYCNDGLKEM